MYICNIIKGGLSSWMMKIRFFLLIQFCSREPETDFFFLICVIFGGEQQQQQLWGKCNLSAKTIHVVLSSKDTDKASEQSWVAAAPLHWHHSSRWSRASSSQVLKTTVLCKQRRQSRRRNWGQQVFKVLTHYTNVPRKQCSRERRGKRKES